MSEKIGFGLCPPYTAMGVEHDGEITGGVVFNHFEGSDVHVTAAGCGWTRAFLKAVGFYVFTQLDCERFTVITEQDSVARLATRLGGFREGVMRNHYGHGRDGIIMGILRDDYPYAMV